MEKENKKTIEIPFGAKDSELYKFEYTIPEGYEARIEDGKVIVKKKESDDERIYNLIYSSIKNDMSIGSPKNKELALAWLEKQKEQKPIFKKGDKVIWQDEEFNILDVNEDSYDVGGYILPFYRQNELSLVEQKPAEWSDDDEKILQSVINRYEWNTKTDFAAFISKEQLENFKKELQWLKSLRPQPHWKPSEEQVSILGKVFAGCKLNTSERDSMVDLFYHLKDMI